MMNKHTAWKFAALAMLSIGALQFTPAALAEDVPGDKSLIAPEGAQGESAGEAPRHEPPIRFTTVDYADAGDAAGKVKLAGTAGPGTVLYIFFDDNPFAKIVVDDEGKWSLENELKLEPGNHTFRAEQYDETTRMLSGRAMVTIARVPPGEAPKDQAAGPQGAPPPTNP